jgi:hypothetical protein
MNRVKIKAIAYWTTTIFGQTEPVTAAADPSWRRWSPRSMERRTYATVDVVSVRDLMGRVVLGMKHESEA